MDKPLPTEPLDRHINQNGIPPGPRKLAQFKEALTLRDTPALYAQEDKGDEAIVHVKLFDPCGSWTWFITEWDGDPSPCDGDLQRLTIQMDWQTLVLGLKPCQ